MQNTKSLAKDCIILVYKNKILLASEQTVYSTPSNSVWNFLKKFNLKNLQLQKAEPIKIGSSIFCIKLTDKDVNELKRQDGLLLEFYTFKELGKLALSEETKQILDDNIELIKEQLAS